LQVAEAPLKGVGAGWDIVKDKAFEKLPGTSVAIRPALVATPR
jgi:hypothetical protein